MLFTLVSLFISTCLCLFSFGSDETAFINDVQKKPSTADIEFANQINNQQKLHLEEFQKIAKNLEFITDDLPINGDGCEGYQIKEQNIQNKELDMKNGIIVFVSFSMPKASLIELHEELEKYNATLVLRGIHEDSFLRTKVKILEINANGLKLNIHPDLFKQYKIPPL